MAIQTNFPAVKPALLLDFANTKRLDPRITFTRTTTATYYDGVTTAKAEENLLLQSQDFTTTWTTTDITVTANTTTAPDGTSTAETIDDGTATAAHNINQLISGIKGATTYVFSCFLKDINRQFATLSVSDSPTTYAAAKFDLVAGTAGSTQAGGGIGWAVSSSSITAAGNGWYRCVLIFVPDVASAGFTVRIGTATDSTTFTASGRGLESYTGSNKQIYIWGAQLEQRSSVTAYTATTTQAITNYIPVLQTASAGQARFDHNPVTRESLGLLAEEQRTNLATYSAQFDNASWAKNALSITSDTIVAPDGTLTGDKAIANTSAAEHYFEQVCSTTTNQSYTQTIYVKRGEESQFGMMVVAVGSSTTTSLAIFSISVGGVVTANGGSAGLISSYSATNVGNGWYRCSIVYTLNGTVTSHRMRIYPGSNSASAVGNGFNGSYFWGAQLEAGAFPTSYIPTVASSATRNADVVVMSGTNFTSWFNDTEGTIYVEAATSSFASTAIWAIGNNTLSFGSGNMMYEAYSSASSVSAVSVIYNGSSQVSGLNSGSALTLNTFSRGAFAYKTNDFAKSTNGATVSTDTSGVLPVGVTGISIGNFTYGWVGASNFLNGTIKKLAYYRKRLTNSQLQNLTS
jgi:hypothetical protein